MLGIKWFCVLSSILATALLYIPIFNGGEITNIIIATTLFRMLYLFIFLFVVKASWVKVVAEAYGKQLIEAINT